MSDTEYQHCLICGAYATQVFASNKNLPLCSLRSCEEALIEEINAELNAAAEAAKE